MLSCFDSPFPTSEVRLPTLSLRLFTTNEPWDGRGGDLCICFHEQGLSSYRFFSRLTLVSRSNVLKAATDVEPKITETEAENNLNGDDAESHRRSPMVVPNTQMVRPLISQPDCLIRST